MTLLTSIDLNLELTFQYNVTSLINLCKYIHLFKVSKVEKVKFFDVIHVQNAFFLGTKLDK